VIEVEFSVPPTQPNLLRQHVKIFFFTNQLQVFCCELTAAGFWPYVGAKLLIKGKTDWTKYLAGLAATPVGVFIAALIAAGNQHVNAPAAANCQQTGDDEFNCDQRFVQGDSALFGRSTLQDCEGLDDGLVLLGLQDAAPETLNPFLAVQVDGFKW